MGYSNVAGDLNVAGTSTLSTLVVNGSTFHYGPITSTSNAFFANLVANTLTVTGNFIVTATNTQVSNSISIVNQGSATALYVNQNETLAHTHNSFEVWDHTTLAMVVDPYGNVAIHTASSPNFALTVVGGISMDVLTLSTPLSISSGGTGTATGATQNYVFAGPSVGSAGAPFFRALVNNDLPSVISVSNVSANGAGLYSLNSSSLVGNVANANVALVVSQPAQPNITSVGTLTGLYASGNITATYFSGGGNALSNVQGSSVAGNVANANVALVVSQASQPNITSVGILTNLAVSNSLTTSNLFLSGNLNVQQTANIYVANIANIYTTNIVGFVGSQWTTGTGNIYYLSNVGIGTSVVSANLSVTGNVYVSNALATTNLFANTITLSNASATITGNLYVSNAITTTNANILSIQTSNLIPATQGLFMNLQSNFTLTSNWYGNIAGTITSNLYTLFNGTGGQTWNAYGQTAGPIIRGPTANGGFTFAQTGPYSMTCSIASGSGVKTLAVSSNVADIHSNVTNVWSYCFRYSFGEIPSIPITLPFYVSSTTAYYYLDIETNVQGDTVYQTAYSNAAANAYTGSYVIIRPI